MPREMSPEAKKNQNAYHREWQKENMRSVSFRFNKRTEADILERLDAQPNVREYIKSLIRADIARTSPASADQGEQGEQE